MTIDLKELFIDRDDLDEKSIRSLLKAIKYNHEDKTFDYIKFKQSIHALISLEMDENTRYKSAYATASTMGLTKESLIKSAQKYLNVLDYERESFAEALKNQISNKIEGRRAEVDEFEKKIESHKRKIKELEREIAIFQNRIDTVDQDVEASSEKINIAKEHFLKVYEAINQNIQNDIDSINTYL